MLVWTSGIKARLTALEMYIGEMREPRGMTLTSRLEAQHRMLVALGENQSETNRRLTRVEDRLTEVESTLGTVLHGITAIKNLLRPPEGPPGGRPSNGTSPP
jgi:hypothetical protein